MYLLQLWILHENLNFQFFQSMSQNQVNFILRLIFFSVFWKVLPSSFKMPCWERVVLWKGQSLIISCFSNSNSYNCYYFLFNAYQSLLQNYKGTEGNSDWPVELGWTFLLESNCAGPTANHHGQNTGRGRELQRVGRLYKATFQASEAATNRDTNGH